MAEQPAMIRVEDYISKDAPEAPALRPSQRTISNEDRAEHLLKAWQRRYEGSTAPNLPNLRLDTRR